MYNQFFFLDIATEISTRQKLNNEIFKNIVTMHVAFDSYIYLKALSHWKQNRKQFAATF